jgi:hypothetical protein
VTSEVVHTVVLAAEALDEAEWKRNIIVLNVA